MKFRIPDHIAFGLIAGAIATIIGIFLFAFVLSTQSSLNFGKFLEQAFQTGNVQKGLFKLALLANLPLFYWLINKKKFRSGYGIIFSTLIFAAIIVIKYHL